MSKSTAVRISKKVIKQGCEAIGALSYASRIRGDDPDLAATNILRNDGANVKMRVAIEAAVGRDASYDEKYEAVRQMAEAYLAN